MDKEKTKSEDQAFLDADFSNIMYEKYGKKWTEYQEAEVKRIEEEQLVSIDNVIFASVPKKRPYPRDKYIYEDERFNPERDTIYLNKYILYMRMLMYISHIQYAYAYTHT